MKSKAVWAKGLHFILSLNVDIKEMTIENATTANSTYTQVGVQCFFEREVLNQSSVLLMKFSAQIPHLR